MKIIDPRNAKELINELHDNYKETIDTFSRNHSENLLTFAEVIAKSHKKLELFRNKKYQNDRVLWVGGFVFLAIDNVYVSAKLLTLGYFAPSGNSMRQSLESVCMAILLSEKNTINIGSVKNPKHIDFFKAFLDASTEVRSHKSLQYVDQNKDILGVSAKGLAAFFEGKDLYNEYSHPNSLTLSSRAIYREGEYFAVGGEYDENKRKAYDKELKDRIRYAAILPNFIENVYSRSKN